MVTRYFGGTLLGTGGLVKAYSKAAKEGLRAAAVKERVLCVRYELTVSYHTYGKLQYELAKDKFKVSDIVYTDEVCLCTVVEKSRADEFSKLVSLCCSGNELLSEMGEGYFDAGDVIL